jgi:hypothetical protein
MKMTKRAIFVVLAVVGLPVQAADSAAVLSARGDALGSGLAALWRETHSDSPAAVGGFADVRQSLIAQSRWLFLPAGSMRSGGLGMARSSELAHSESSLGTGPGFGGRFSAAHAATMGLDESLPNWWSTAATFERGAWRAFAALERAQDWSGSGATDEGWRLGAAYRFGGAQVTAGWERLHHDVDTGDARQQAWWIGLAQRVGDGALRLNFARATDVSGNLATGLGGGRQLSFGYELGLSGQTAVYAFYTRLSNDPNGLFRLGGGEVESGMSASGRSGISLGVRHSF